MMMMVVVVLMVLLVGAAIAEPKTEASQQNRRTAASTQLIFGQHHLEPEMEETRNEFSVWDYVVFVSVLLISVVIGVYFAVVGGKQSTQGEFLLGNRQLSILPVTISILVSFQSAILILGTPAEIYTQGTEYFLSTFGVCLGILLAVLFFVPLLYPLKITSAFEYLEIRFNSRSTRLLGSVFMMISEVLYMAIASFAPSTALEAVTGIPAFASVVIICLVSTVYTSIGGIKAVIWTDVFQSGVMLAGILAIVIQGTIEVGGVSQVWKINNEFDRIKFFNFDANPTTRHSVWSLFVGTATIWVGVYGISQASVQRLSSLPTLNKARISMLLNMLGAVITISLVCLSGIVLFAYYAKKGCDPLGLGLVDNSNQLIPYFVMEILGYPGVPGLFISSLFSGALSSVSSSLSSLAALTWEDILKPHLDKRLTESRKTLVIKSLVIAYGCTAIGLSFAIENLGGTISQVSTSLVGSVGGPLTGMFVLGGFFPWANSYGALAGGICGFAISMWLSIGSYAVGINLLDMPYPNGTCLRDANGSMTTASPNFFSTTTTPSGGETDSSGLGLFYSISYLWYSAIGTITVIIVGLAVSLITGCNAKEDAPTRPHELIFSALLCRLPEPVLFKLDCCRRFGRQSDTKAAENNADLELIASVRDDDTKRSLAFGDHLEG